MRVVVMDSKLQRSCSTSEFVATTGALKELGGRVCRMGVSGNWRHAGTAFVYRSRVFVGPLNTLVV